MHAALLHASALYRTYNLQMSLTTCTIDCSTADIYGHPSGARSASPTHCQTVIPPFLPFSFPPFLPRVTPTSVGPGIHAVLEVPSLHPDGRTEDRPTDAHPIGGTRFDSPPSALSRLPSRVTITAESADRGGLGWPRTWVCREGGAEEVRCGKSGGWGWGWGWMVGGHVCAGNARQGRGGQGRVLLGMSMWVKVEYMLYFLMWWWRLWVDDGWLLG
jgi:hypothetical protein